VNKESGTLGLAGHRERQIAVEADHNNICKFWSAESDDYEQVSSNLAFLVNAAVKVVMGREGTPPSPILLTRLEPYSSGEYVPRILFNALSSC
jgi:hypothetical protein